MLAAAWVSPGRIALQLDKVDKNAMTIAPLTQQYECRLHGLQLTGMNDLAVVFHKCLDVVCIPDDFACPNGGIREF